MQHLLVRLSLICIAIASMPARPASVAFDWFEYTGRDAVFEQPLPSGHYRNPILAGFYPDPSITRVGNRFYLVNSTFAYFPGIPVFESDDLVRWRQIGNVISRPSQLNFDGRGISRGVFAPTIDFHDGLFYVVNTAVDSGGNFFVTAKDPAGPWSDPIWLPEIDGIDPSFFFDSDGKAYILNNGLPEGKLRYEGHRAIWIQQFDVAARKLTGPRKVLVDGGVDPSKNPIWIEGPHLYRRGEWYYLMCAEGGTEAGHSEVIFRSRSPWGPFKPFEGNPILTQRDLSPDRANPIANAGHADLIEAPDGSWWAVFLAVRPYDKIHFNTGRETYLLPVAWRDGWPIILDAGKPIPYVMRAPGFTQKAGTNPQAPPLTGNFTWRDEFDADAINPLWLQVRVPKDTWTDLRSKRGWLTIQAKPALLSEMVNPSFLARRQQHTAFEASTALELPAEGKVAAGLAAFQSESYWYFLGARRRNAQQIELFLESRSGDNTKILATSTIAAGKILKLRITGDAGDYSFFYDTDGSGWKTLKNNADGRLLSTLTAGGFVGATIGPYARVER